MGNIGKLFGFSRNAFILLRIIWMSIKVQCYPLNVVTV